MSEKHINKSPIPCQMDSTKSPIPCESDSTKSPLPQHEGRLGVGIIPQGYKQTSIGIIPQDWEVVRLGEVGDIVGGGTPDTTNPAFWNGKIAWISSSDIDEDSIYKISTRRFINEFAIKNSATNLIPAKSVLIISRVSVGKVAINENPLCTSQDTQSLIPNNDNYIFMAYLVKFNIRKLLQYNQGTSIKGFTKTELKSLQIPLPPLKEQEKIARILGVWDSAIDSLANLIKAKRKYKTALMQRLLTPPRYTTSCHTERSEVSKSKSVDFVDTSAFSKPQYDKVLDSCNDTPLCHTASSSCHTASPSCHTDTLSRHTSTSCHTEGVARSIQKDDLQGNDICLDSSLSAKAQNDKEKNAENGREINPQNDKENTHNDKKKIRESSLRFAGFSDKWQEFRLGDICKIKKGEQLNKLSLSDNMEGKFAVINGGILPSGYTDKFNTHENTITISEGGNSCGFVNLILEKFWSGGHCYTIADSKADTLFLFHSLKFREKFIQDLRVGSGLPNIQKKDIEKFKIFIPTLAEQKKIAQVLSACDKEIETLNLKFECLKTQKRGLMQQLLSGKVRVKC